MSNEEAVYYLQYLRHNVQADSLYDVALVRAIEALKNVEFGEDEPVKCGRWERRTSNIYACSECTNEVTYRQSQNYSCCPYCGAVMRGEENDKL